MQYATSEKWNSGILNHFNHEVLRWYRVQFPYVSELFWLHYMHCTVSNLSTMIRQKPSTYFSNQRVRLVVWRIIRRRLGEFSSLSSFVHTLPTSSDGWTALREREREREGIKIGKWQPDFSHLSTKLRKTGQNTATQNHQTVMLFMGTCLLV